MVDFWLDGSDEGKALGDTVVQGKPVREWKVSDFSGDADEMRAFEAAVWDVVPVSRGNHLHEIFGQEFHDDFYSRRSRLIAKEQMDDVASNLVGRVTAHVGGRSKVRMVHLFQVAHVGWEMDNDYGLFDVDGTIRLFGTNHGGLKELDYAELASIKFALDKMLAGVNDGLRILGDALRETR